MQGDDRVFIVPVALLLPIFFLTTLEDLFYTKATQGCWFLWAAHGLVLPVFMFSALTMAHCAELERWRLQHVSASLWELALCTFIVSYAANATAPWLLYSPNVASRFTIVVCTGIIQYHVVWRICEHLTRGVVDRLKHSLKRRGWRRLSATSSDPSPVLTALASARVAAYYVVMISFPVIFMLRRGSAPPAQVRFDGGLTAQSMGTRGCSWYGLFQVKGHTWTTVIGVLKWCIMLCLPNVVLNTLGQLRWPACLERAVPPLDAQLKLEHGFKLYFRIVTRGTHPNLVRANAEEVASVLASTLHPEKWEVEVATDNALGLDEHCRQPVTEILTPSNYSTSTGAKFKARALQFAIENSAAGPQDWVIHLDEETKLDAAAVPHIYHHCATEHELTMSGAQQYGKIGQGGILYGCGEVENWITTLADSLRVADDYGKFRVQFELGECWVGMHGSFVVCQNAVEQAVTFDHGMAGSITEDAYFALVARSMGVRYAWIDCHMYEQSPFSVRDFIMQRRRWFGGLYLVCIAPKVDLGRRLTLGFMTAAWALQPFAFVGMVVSWAVCSSVTDSWRISCNLVAGLWYWCYFLGFIKTFSLKDGTLRYIVLLVLQLLLLPLFAAMECAGVVCAIYDPPMDGFFVVQKEASQAKPKMQAKSSRAEALTVNSFGITSDNESSGGAGKKSQDVYGSFQDTPALAEQ
ncbi:hypothetical protein CYMTET_34206 [Cymbomonas tetramitiformis]|uniref:Glycosyltransferase 2-like domain-containing protein n=1 Tax=Cymbomonas tetramitiformis TaxID=36881 RepID=A0AAE0FBI3_9CHLO|nr:hypothetical protein CYMTET_34206 [Cymbomonas tetramitiformis]